MLTYDPPDSDYGRIFTQARIIAWQFGFALLTHGSRTRDLDVLMVPWEERASTKIVPAIINRIAQVAGLTVKGEPSDKPHGRKAYTLFLPDMVRWVDLSVVPCRTTGPEAPSAPKDPEHVCGLQGYNGMIDPPCPGCEARNAAWESTKAKQSRV
jgi:hypothetical protein